MLFDHSIEPMFFFKISNVYTTRSHLILPIVLLCILLLCKKLIICPYMICFYIYLSVNNGMLYVQKTADFIYVCILSLIQMQHSVKILVKPKKWDTEFSIYDLVVEKKSSLCLLMDLIFWFFKGCKMKINVYTLLGNWIL